MMMVEQERAPAAFFLEGEHSGDGEPRMRGRGDSRGRGGGSGGDGRERGAPDGLVGMEAERWRRRPSSGRRGQRHSGVERVRWGGPREGEEHVGGVRRWRGGLCSPESRRPSMAEAIRGELRRDAGAPVY